MTSLKINHSKLAYNLATIVGVLGFTHLIFFPEQFWLDTLAIVLAVGVIGLKMTESKAERKRTTKIVSIFLLAALLITIFLYLKMYEVI